jgi:hypothetical protein
MVGRQSDKEAIIRRGFFSWRADLGLSRCRGWALALLVCSSRFRGERREAIYSMD